MLYTIKKLAKISGVTVRTLQYYDKIGLLKPFLKGANNYRYYKEEQLIKLQQVLFFKELDFSLNDIKTLIEQNAFDNIKSLKVHKAVLKKQVAHKNDLIKTINKTIMHLEEKVFMRDEELYYGFDIKKQKEYEQYLVKEYGSKAEDLLKQSHIRTAKWNKEEWDYVKNTGDQIHKDLTKAINLNLTPESEEVQIIIHHHYELQNRFYDLSQEVYIELADLYVQHPDFKKFFDVYHPELIQFIGEAMRYYANKNL